MDSPPPPGVNCVHQALLDGELGESSQSGKDMAPNRSEYMKLIYDVCANQTAREKRITKSEEPKDIRGENSKER